MSARIIRAADAGLLREAARVLAEARDEAEAIRGRALAEVAAARAQAVREAEIHAALGATRMLAETAASTRQVLDGLLPDIAGAIAAGVARILGGMPQDAAVAAAARRAIEDLAAAHGLAVHVHPAAIETVRQALGAEAGRLRIVGDENLPRDACTVETDAGIIRAGLTDQIGALRDALMAEAAIAALPASGALSHA